MSELGFRERHVPAAAADAARALARGNVAARWRLVPDGTLEVVRPNRSHVELHRIAGDGTSMLVEKSPRSWRRAIGRSWFGVAFGGCFAAFAGLAIADSTGYPGASRVLGLAFGVLLASMFVVGAVTPSDNAAVERWLRTRQFPLSDWARVPRAGDLGDASAEQQIAVAQVADAHGGSVPARVAHDGTVEVSTRAGRGRIVRRLDRGGHVVHEERQTLPSPAPTRLALGAAVAALAVAIFAAGPIAWIAGTSVPVALYVAARFAPGERAPLDGEWEQVRTDDPGD